MSPKHWIGCLLLAVSLAACVGRAAAADDKPAGESAPNADYQQVYDQWKKALAELGEMQITLAATPPAQRGSIAGKYTAALKTTAELAAKLKAAAEKAYAADDKNPQLGALLFSMAVADLRTDDVEDALRLAKLLIDHNYPNKEVYRVAASAAFATMQLDEAKKYLDLFNGGVAPTDPRLINMQAAIDHYRPKWEREEKLRAAEAKADDLPRVKLHTSAGDMVVELFENEAPNTVANFISLVEKGFYDGVLFHRVLPNFMAQGGDPITKDPSKYPGQGVGSGGPGYTIDDECFQANHREHFRGSLSMAHTEARNSGGSQFFLMFVPNESLDGKYTVFGRVIDGLDVLGKIQRIDPEKPGGFVAPPELGKIIKAEVLRKRDHAYEPKTNAKAE